MAQELFDWALLLGRWLHIIVGITWIGTSIFFMWLDRTLTKDINSTTPGHVGDLWMVHGGGFYRVEKMLMGPTKVPEVLHWFKWEAYWTWISGLFLLLMIFYTGGGTFLLDSSVSDISFIRAAFLGLFSLFGSWVFYDFLWERKLTREKPLIGHVLTLVWFAGMSYLLCQYLSGRAAYIHIGGMLGTWMVGNVAMRIIPRQVLMVAASKQGTEVDPTWGQNAKNRSTHNTYFTLPVIFIMLSNHFPATYGHDQGWLVLLLLSAAGAAIREFFVARNHNNSRSKLFGVIGVALLVFTIAFTHESDDVVMLIDPPPVIQVPKETKKVEPERPEVEMVATLPKVTLKGVISFSGPVPKGKKLRLPRACEKQHIGDVLSNEVMVKEGKLQNVLIRVIKGLEGKTFSDIPDEEVILDQRGCIYSPRVTAARVGQKVAFLNSDPVFHNVKSVTKKNKSFNLAMPKTVKKKVKVFSKPEIFLQTKCSVHPWMAAYIAIMDHPFFSVSSSSGEVELRDLPHGRYTIEAWHETLGTQTKEIEVSQDSNPDLNFEFSQK